MPPTESSFADLLPLWRTLREDGVTALVTPALDYVGALEVAPVDGRFLADGELEGLGEALRSLLCGLDDGATLHFLYRVDDNVDAEVRSWRAATGPDAGPERAAAWWARGGERGALNTALLRYTADRAAWLRRQPLRIVRLQLFFSAPSAGSALSARGALGLGLFTADLARLTHAAHRARLQALSNLRNALQTRLAQAGLGSRELTVAELQQTHRALLSPRAPLAPSAKQVRVRENLWDEATVRAVGPHLAEYSEAEQLVTEDLVEADGHLRLGATFRRALTLKLLPEGGTSYFNAEPLLQLSEVGRDGEGAPFPYWLGVTVHLERQGRARWLLNSQHGLVDALKNAVPFLADKSVARQARDDAKQQGIHALFEELNALSSKLATVSVTVLLDAPSLEVLDARTESARAAFSAAGNSELYREEVSQLPAFLSLLPGAGRYQHRRKACTTRNAADFLPVFAPWSGSARAGSLLSAPSGDLFRLDLFDKSLASAHHGLVAADTGSGKSVTLGALTLDALAGGSDAILIDNGGSWAPLTTLLGGVHLPVDLRTPLTPFRPWAEVAGAVDDGGLDGEAVQDVVGFLELCVREEGERGFDKLTVQLVARAVQRAYRTRFRAAPQERPLMSAFRDALGALGAECVHPDDRRICEDLHRRLGLFVGDALYGTFLDQPSTLRFDAPLLTFDMAGVSKSPITRSIAMATVIQAVMARAAQQRLVSRRGADERPRQEPAGERPSRRDNTKRPTLCVVDEGHAYLGVDETAERFLERCYRTMRKFNVAMWMVSQQFADFAHARSGDAIIGNATLKLFLKHASGHDEIARHFDFSPRALAAFRNLSMRAGHHSDFLLLYGQRMASLRLGLHPLAYWMLTTDPGDRALIARTRDGNPQSSELEVLEALAARFPHGSFGAGSH